MHLAEVNIALVGDLVRLVADTRTGCINNLDILTVVFEILYICAIIGLDRIGSIFIQSSVCIKIAIAIVRRRCPAHKCRQHRRGTALVDAPLRTGRTCVVDGTAPA